MLWLAQPTKHRCTIEARKKKLNFWDATKGRWTTDFVLAVSPTAAVKLDSGGQKLDLRSKPGHSQRIVFFDEKDGHSVGTIEVNAAGAFMIRKGVDRAKVNTDWPAFWLSQVVAVIQLQKPIELVVTDRIGGGSGTIVYDVGHTVWHIPGIFWEKTRNYDNGEDREDVRLQPIGMPPSIQTDPIHTPPIKRSSRTASVVSNSSRAASVVSSTREKPQKEEKVEDQDMPPLINHRVSNDMASESSFQPGRLLNYQQIIGNGIRPWEFPGSGIDEMQSPSREVEGSQFQTRKKANGSEGLFDATGEIEWVTGGDQAGVHYTLLSRRPYRHISGLCNHCMR